MKKLFIIVSLLFSIMLTSVSAVEVTQEAKITGLYVAYFNRAADQEGLNYWTDKSDEVAQADGDISLVFKKLSAGFATHPTFKSTYDHLNNKEFVSLIYRNALGRDGDTEGIAYWTKKLDNEGMIRSDMVSDFVELSLVTDLTPENYPNLSAEELAAGQLRQDLITNKVTVALAFTKQLGVLSNVVDSQDPEEDPAYLASIKIISEVTEEPETVSGTLDFLDSIKESDDPIRDILEAGTIVPGFEKVIIGSEGGVVKGANGAIVTIPEGALSDTYNISVSSYLDNESLPEGWAPIPVMRGAVVLKPEGLTFNKPVMITVPIDSYMDPGSRFPLFYWNESTQTWEQTSLLATVADDGMSFDANITHFSGYGGGAVENFISGGIAEIFMEEFSSWFQANVAKTGDKKEKKNDCFRVTGMDFDLKYEINGETGSEFKRIDEKSDDADSPLIMVDYKYDATNGYDFSGYIQITVVIYYKCTEPDFTAIADRSVLGEGESTSVKASLSCADVPLIEKNVTFDIQSGPGEVSPGNTTTNSSGTATATFTAGDSDTVVRAYYYACESVDSLLMERTIPISVAAAEQYNLAITFVQTMSVDDFSHSFTYGGTVPLRRTYDNIGGTEKVEGSSTFDVTGGGMTGDCTTVTSGTVTFTFTGTLVTDNQGAQTLHLTQSPDFSTITTTYCPDDPPLVNYFLTGGEDSDFIIPVEDGYTFGEPVSGGGISSEITYVLTIL